ncbi:MAG: TetR/AcrR family transcriptional regulator [Cytophagales bacterium]|nr:TetR/AcrR family transcriptional regulator [Cytophagales bacterium]
MSSKENIQNVALKLFLTKGYNVGINEIIEQANTSKGAFYHHFKSKEQLFMETIDEYFFGFLDNLSFLDKPNLDFDEQILKLVKLVFTPVKKLKDIFKDGEQFNYLGVLSEYPKNDVLRQKSREHLNLFINKLQEIIEQSQQAGKIKGSIDKKVLSFHISMLIDGSIVDALTIFDNIYKAEKECIKAIKQLIGLIK